MLGLLPELTEQNGLSVSWCTTPFSGQMTATMPGIVRGRRENNECYPPSPRTHYLPIADY